MTTAHATPGVYSTPGEEFVRDSTYITTRIVRDPVPGSGDYPVEPGRYRLVAARACPWATRALIVRRLLGLEDAISVGLPGPIHDAGSWASDTVTLASAAGVPHHEGFRASTADPAEETR